MSAITGRNMPGGTRMLSSQKKDDRRSLDPAVISLSKKRERNARASVRNCRPAGPGGLGHRRYRLDSAPASSSTSSPRRVARRRLRATAMRQLAQPRGRVVGDDVAGAQNDDARADLLDRVDFVRAVEDEPACRRERAHERPRSIAPRDVEPDAGSSRMTMRGSWSSAAESRTFCRMPLSRRQLRVAVGVEAEHSRKAIDFRSSSRPRSRAAARPGAGIGPGQEGVDVRLFRHVADLGLVASRWSWMSSPRNSDRALGRRHQPGEHLHRGGLAGPVRTQVAEHLARPGRRSSRGAPPASRHTAGDVAARAWGGLDTSKF